MRKPLVSMVAVTEDDFLLETLEVEFLPRGYAVRRFRDLAELAGAVPAVAADLGLFDIRSRDRRNPDHVEAILRLGFGALLLLVPDEPEEHFVRALVPGPAHVAVVRRPCRLDRIRKCVDLLVERLEEERRDGEEADEIEAAVRKLPWPAHLRYAIARCFSTWNGATVSLALVLSLLTATMIVGLSALEPRPPGLAGPALNGASESLDPAFQARFDQLVDEFRRWRLEDRKANPSP